MAGRATCPCGRCSTRRSRPPGPRVCGPAGRGRRRPPPRPERPGRRRAAGSGAQYAPPHDRTRPLRRDRPRVQSRAIFGAAALGERLQARRRPHARAAARARHQPHRRRRELRRRRAAHRDVAAAPRGRVLRGDEDRRAHLPRRARGDPPLARPPRRRPRRLDPAAQPRRRDRVGDGARRRRRARGGDRGARGRARALHRRHRPRPVGARDAPAQPRALPVRLRAAARTTTSRCRTRATPRRSRRSPRVCAGAQRRAADDQEPRVAPLGRPRRDRRDLVRAAARAGRHRPRRRTGCSDGPRSSCSPPATSRSCRGCSTPRSASSDGRPTSRWPSSPSGGISRRCSSEGRGSTL